MKTFECPSCGNTLTEKDVNCKYCGSANPIYNGPIVQTKPNQYLQSPSLKKSGSKTNEINSIPLGFFAGLILGWIGLIISIFALKGKKTIKASVVAMIISYSITILLIITSITISIITTINNNSTQLIMFGV